MYAGIECSDTRRAQADTRPSLPYRVYTCQGASDRTRHPPKHPPFLRRWDSGMTQCCAAPHPKWGGAGAGPTPRPGAQIYSHTTPARVLCIREWYLWLVPPSGLPRMIVAVTETIFLFF